MANTYGYVRVSTADQNEARQIKALRGQSLVSLLQELRVKVFAAADMEWLDFILTCRSSQGTVIQFERG